MSTYHQEMYKRHLPSGYTSIEDIIAGRLPVGRLVSLIGLVKDHQAPIPTKGDDYKCTYTVYDDSTEDGQTGLVLSMFGGKDDMPQPSAGDVLVISSAKVQLFRGSISLISHHSMSVHIYSASYIPRPPRSAEGALRFSYGSRKPGEKEHEYVSWLWHNVNKDPIPDASTFQKHVDQSGYMKNKFCMLENVVDGKFCDVIVNVVKAPFGEMEKTTLWVSDYTENDSFYKFSYGENQSRKRDGDPYGGRDSHSQAAAKWAGPFGKRSMQVTCFEPHASQVNSEVQLGQWIRIRNLRIKFGNNGVNLEGVLHGNRDFGHQQVGFNRQQIDILKYDEEGCDSRLKQAIQRKKLYENLMKRELRNLEADENVIGAGSKRRADDNEEPKANSKARRKERRAAAVKRVGEQDKQAEDRLGLNDLIKCESPEQPLTAVPSIIKPVSWETTIDGEAVSLMLPFTCAKYRIYARVVDFRPHRLENFATWRKSTESDVLSDYSSSSDSGSDDDGHSSLDQFSRHKIWEWRFALQLEDADPKTTGEKARFWAVVNNTEAQQLTGLDACDLRDQQDTLNALREKLFKLWGNLEEAKLHDQQRQLMDKRRVATNQPPPSSPSSNNGGDQQHEMGGVEGKDENGVNVSNKPFACCIHQYGVRVREHDPCLANAGEGFRWVKVFGLYGTKIGA
ncbi:hypothetical protein GGR50DRAFT_637487 [Xylaria sp. CBS 124048]|nr:hypothetical protein GGR50DRAFT_637487 [Xylaria sp. CBS 124048]